MEIVAQFQRLEGVELVPTASVSVLPLTPEPISEWAADGDLCQFLMTLFDQDTVMIDATGRKHQVNYAHYGKHLYETGLREFSEWSKDFSKRAHEVNPPPASESNLKTEIPDFLLDPSFGLMAKYAIAWSGTISAILSEDGFSSIAHTLESEDDSRCSIVLASHLYYRQAGQILRNVIEDVLAQMYFCEDDEAFARWRAGEFQMPRLRGKGGILENLVKRRTRPQELADKTATLYGKLSWNEDGGEARLGNAGLCTGEFTGQG